MKEHLTWQEQLDADVRALGAFARALGAFGLALAGAAGAELRRVLR